MTFDELFLVGHSYAVGIAALGGAGVIDDLDVSLGGFSPVDDSFTRADTPVEQDTFTRADSTTTLGSTESTAKPWTAHVGTWGILSNQARVVTSGGAVNYATFDAGASDGAWQVQWAVGTGDCGQIIRLVDADNYLYVWRSGANAAQLRKVVAGVDTQIGSDMTGITFVAGVVLSICLNGPNIAVNFAGNLGAVPVTLGTFTDSTFQTATRFGLLTKSVTPTATRWDNATFMYQERTPSPVGNVVPNQVSGCWAVRSGQMQLVSSNGSTNLLTWDAGWADGVIELEIGTYSEAMGLCFRVQDASNYLRVSVSSITGAWVLGKVVAGIFTQISSGILGENSAGTVMRIFFEGTRVRMVTGQGIIISNPSDYTVTEFATATQHGFYMPHPGALPVAWDNLHLSRVHLAGQGGSAVAQSTSPGSYVRVLQEIPRLTASSFAVTLTGLNDIYGNVNARGEKAWQEAMRTVIARFLAETVYEDSDASVTHVGTWSTVTVTGRCSGVGYHSTTTVGDHLDVAVPAGFEGGTIQLGWVSPPNDGGGVASIEVDGLLVATVNTQGTFAATNYVGMVTRLQNLTAGAHTIRITVTAVGAEGFMFDYWATEQTTPKIAVCNIARIIDYSSYFNAFDDNDVITYNTLLAAIIDEFGTNVRLIDIDYALNKRVDYFDADGVHPNTAGHRRIADAIIATLTSPAPTAHVGATSYIVIVEDVMGNYVIGELPVAALTYEDYINRPGRIDLEVALSVADDHAEMLDVGRRGIYVVRNGVIDMGGLLVNASVSPGGSTVRLIALGWLGWFDMRDIWHDRQFTGTEQFSIFKQLVDDAQDTGLAEIGAGADLGIEVIWDAVSGVTRDRTAEYRWFNGKNLGEALRELAACENGFDFAMRYGPADNSISKEVKLYYPQKGVDHTDEPGFEYIRGAHGNILQRGLTFDATKMAWRMRGWGAGQDTSRLLSSQVRDDYRGVYPFFDGQFTQSSVIVQGTLDEQTYGALSGRDHVVGLPQIEVDPLLNPKWEEYELGDIYNITMVDGYCSMAGAFRIIGFKMDARLDVPTLYIEEQ